MQIRLKEIERKAYTSYYNDGLLEIFLGGAILFIGIALSLDAAYLFGIVPAIVFASWAGAKRMITVPRIGHVKFGPQRLSRMAKEKRFFTIYFSITVVAGFVVFLLVTLRTAEARRIFGAYPLAPIGIIGAIALAFLAYWKQIQRIYLYAVLLPAALFGAPHFGIKEPHYMIGLGSVILAAGIVLLIRFLRTYSRSPMGENHA
jgi:hypothetical protein